MKRLLFSILVLLFSFGVTEAQTTDIAEYSMYEVYRTGEATLIKAVKENRESYVLRITQTGMKAMNIVLGTKGDALVTLQTILDKPLDYRVLFKLDNPSNNTAGYFLKKSNSTTLVRFYEGLNLNNYADISLKKLKRIHKRLSN